MEHIACEYCGSDKADRLYVSTDVRYGGQEKFNLVKCRQCDLVYLNPQPTAEELKPYYDKYYSVDAIQHDSSKEKYSVLKHNEIRRLCKYIEKGRILDVGCGKGDFLSKISQRGWYAVGIELNTKVARYARETHKIHIHEVDFAQVQYPPKSFDVIRLNHVLEHLHAPSKALSKIHSLLKDDGVLILACPNFNWSNQLLFADKWDALDTPRHLFQFNEKTLNKLASKEGFEAAAVYHGQWFHNFVVFKKSVLNKLNLQKLRPGKKNLIGSVIEQKDKKSSKILKWSFNVAIILISIVQSSLKFGGTIEVYYRKRR